MSLVRPGILKAIATALVVTAGVLSLSAGADAESHDSGHGYPRFAHEDLYPENTSCHFRLRESTHDRFAGRTITLRYFYSRGCGSYARIDNAPRSCEVWLDRTRGRDTIGGWDSVYETVDPGLDFAYTRIGNNLHGRLSRAALVCGKRHVAIARTRFR
jgi:hypothetical protein